MGAKVVKYSWQRSNELDLAALLQRIQNLEEDTRALKEDVQMLKDENEANKAVLLKWEAVSSIITAMDQFVWENYMATHVEQLDEYSIYSVADLYHAAKNCYGKKGAIAQKMLNSVEKSVLSVVEDFREQRTGVGDGRIIEDYLLRCLCEGFPVKRTPSQDDLFEYVKNALPGLKGGSN